MCVHALTLILPMALEKNQYRLKEKNEPERRIWVKGLKRCQFLVTVLVLSVAEEHNYHFTRKTQQGNSFHYLTIISKAKL